MYEPAKLVDVDLESGHVHAVRFGVRPTHTVRSVAYAALGLLFAAMAVGSLVLTIGDPTSDAMIGTVVLMVFAGAFILAGLAGIRISRRGLGIDLTPSAVTVGLGGDRTVLAWDDVTAIAAGTDSDGATIEISARDEKVVSVLRRKLKSDPQVVIQAIRHYHQNPGHRDELAGDDGVRRINNLTA